MSPSKKIKTTFWIIARKITKATIINIFKKTYFNSKTIMRLHRNSQKRYYEENLIYFIVTKTFENFPYFKEPIFCDLLIEDLKICKELKQFKLYGFCLIYDHLNLLIHPSKESNVSKIIQNIKRTTSLHINQIISGNLLESDNNLSEGDNIYCRLQEKSRLQTKKEKQ